MTAYKEQVIKLLETVLNDVKVSDVSPSPVGHPEHLWDTISGFKFTNGNDEYECRIQLPMEFYERLN